MHDFTYNNISLSSFGGRLLQPPTHTIAARNKSFAKIYGQSGDEVIDNESYNNVKFKLKICFLPYLTQQAAQALAYAVIDWLAPLQDKYYEYRDTVNPNYFTYAVLTNFDQVERELPSLLTTTLEFNRVPFWYSDNGQIPVTFYNGGIPNTINNPELYDAEPLYRFVTLRPGGDTLNITVNDQQFSAYLDYSDCSYYFDNVQKQFYRYQNGDEATNEKVYLSPLLLPNLKPGENIITFNLDGVISSGSFHLTIIPNWRRL